MAPEKHTNVYICIYYLILNKAVITTYYIDKHLVIIMVTSCHVQTVSLLEVGKIT